MGNKINSINGVLGRIKKLDMEEQAYILEVLFKRLVEQRSAKIAKRAIEAEDNYEIGEAKIGTLKDLWEDLNA
ncbi:MAG: hypothetical protein HY769_10275 [Candidatus Stahlbacteria bacterium]|nr:hypothetical protein [Candidatus Stahlbacteria bacterium]